MMIHRCLCPWVCQLMPTRTDDVSSDRIHFDQDERFLPTTPYRIRRNRRTRGAGHLFQRRERVRRAPREGPRTARAGDGPRVIAVGERWRVADRERMVGEG